MEKIHEPATENVSSSEKLTDMFKMIPQEISFWTIVLTFRKLFLPMSVSKNEIVKK